MSYTRFALFPLILSFLLSLIRNHTHAQPFVGGLKKTKGRDMTVGNKLAVSDDEFRKLRPSISFEEFCPEAGNQQGKATTVAYATAYYLRTILENQAHNVRQPSAVNTNRFSPAYLYNRIKSSEDIDCKAGADLETALTMLRNEGVPLLKTVGEQSCTLPASTTLAQEAARHRISEFTLLFGASDSKINKLRLLKKTLADGTPVLVEFQAPESFTLAKKVWTRATNETPALAPYSLALCVIGYDDAVSGGAFRVANSWGSGWGDAGKCWITYEDMKTFTQAAYRVAPVSADVRTLVTGKVDIRLTNNQLLPVVQGKAGAYELSGPYPAGKEIKLYASTTETTHLYVFGLSPDGVSRYVPAADASAPVLRPGDAFVFPSESETVTLEKALGQDYLLFLFCRQPISNMTAFIKQLQQTPGTAEQKIASLLASSPAESIDYTPTALSFSITTLNPSIQIPILIRL